MKTVLIIYFGISLDNKKLTSHITFLTPGENLATYLPYSNVLKR